MHARTYQTGTLFRVATSPIRLHLRSTAICFHSITAYLKVLVELQQDCGVPSIESILVSDVCLSDHLQMIKQTVSTLSQIAALRMLNSITNCCPAYTARGFLDKLSGEDQALAVTLGCTVGVGKEGEGRKRGGGGGISLALLPLHAG